MSGAGAGAGAAAEVEGGALTLVLDRWIQGVQSSVAADGMRPDEAGFDAVWDRLAEAAQRYCSLRVRGEMRVDVALVDGRGRLLGRCDGVRA